MNAAATTQQLTDDARQLDPLAVGAREAARLCGVSLRSWWRLVAAGIAPRSYRLLGRTVFRFSDLRAWADAGFPRREDS